MRLGSAATGQRASSVQRIDQPDAVFDSYVLASRKIQNGFRSAADARKRRSLELAHNNVVVGASSTIQQHTFDAFTFLSGGGANLSHFHQLGSTGIAHSARIDHQHHPAAVQCVQSNGAPSRPRSSSEGVTRWGSMSSP